MLTQRSALTDGVVGASLVCALLVTFALDRSAPEVEPEPVGTGEVDVFVEPAEPPRPLLLAVTPPKYDDMGALLRKLGSGGEGYAFDNIEMEAFEEPGGLSKYDVIFFTCGLNPRHWFEDRSLGGADRPGINVAPIRESVYAKVRSTLRGFVEKGGTLYASDWRLIDLDLCFPELVEDGLEDVKGDAQTVNAEVVEPALVSRLGSTVDLKFDLGGWYPARISARDATVYLRGNYTSGQGRRRVSAPLLVKVPFGDGTIIFTSFHNEKINSDVETKLLEFLVFESLLARESAKLRKVMVSGGLSPQKSDILSTSAGAPSRSLVYKNSRRGRLVFALGFNNEGARLRLTVTGPSGKEVVKEGATSFTVDVPDAEAGDWTYKVSAVKLPYANFPYNLTVGDD